MGKEEETHLEAKVGSGHRGSGAGSRVQAGGPTLGGVGVSEE